VGVVMVVVGVLVIAVGLWRDIARSRRDKGPVGGPGGTFRSLSLRGFTSGLPFYVAGFLLILLAP
jgi:hypothetical protein